MKDTQNEPLAPGQRRQRARLALWLTRQASVTGSAGELALPGALLERIRARPALAGAASWLIAADDDAARRGIAA